MTRIKILRIVMLLTLVVFVGVVVTSYRSGKTISETSSDEELSRLVAGEQIIQKEFNRKSYKKEKLETEISARELVNYQDGVNVLEDIHFTRDADGMDVKSDFGRHDQESGDAFLWDNVLIENAEGMTLSTASALYHESRRMLVGDKPVTFSDNRLSGSSLGVLYDMDSGTLQLPAQVELTIRGEEDEPMDPVTVSAGFLKLIKEPGIAYLARGVRLQQGRLSLDCRTLRIDFDASGRRIRHVSAFGDVVLEMAAGSGDQMGSPEKGQDGMSGLGDDPGRKTLRASQMEIFFPSTGSQTDRLEYLVARGSDQASAVLRLTTLPADGSAAVQQTRQVEARRLVFRFRSQGPPNRLESFHAEGGCLLRMFESGSQGQSNEEEVRIAGDVLTARFDAVMQDLEAAEISGDVLFTRGEERIRGQRANFDAGPGLLRITGEENGRLPRMWNETIDLEAVEIVYGVDGQFLQAEDNVWVQVKGKKDDLGLEVPLFSRGGDEEPIYIHADRLESDLEAGVSNFRGDVRVLKGENVLSARNMWLYHKDRRMEALEKVTMIIHPLADTEEVLEEAAGPAVPVRQLADGLNKGTGAVEDGIGALPEEQAAEESLDRFAPLQINCHKLTYDDQARYIVLDQRVRVRKHKTRMNADHMEIQLEGEGNRIQHIIASAVTAGTDDRLPSDTVRPDLLLTGFDSQRSRNKSTMVPGVATDQNPQGSQVAVVGGPTDSAVPEGEKGMDDGRTAGGARPLISQVTLSQPGGRTAAAERILYYPEEQLAVLVGINTVATIVDPRSGSAQGTSLTYHLADGKILNRANENEVTLVLLHTGAGSAELAGTESSVSTRGAGKDRAASSRPAGTGFAGRSSPR